MRAYEVARPLADQLGMILVPGVEITRPVPGRPSPWPVGSAHFNALYIRDDGPLDAPELADALGLAKRQGAFITWNHPAFMGRRAQWFPHVDEVHRQGLFQGIEIVNGDEYSPEAFGWALEKQLTILAASDAHLPMPAHLRSARRPATILFAVTRDAAGVRDALEARRTLAWLDDDMWGEEQWVRATWDGALRTPPVPARAGAEFVAAIENVTSISFDLELPGGPLDPFASHAEGGRGGDHPAPRTDAAGADTGAAPVRRRCGGAQPAPTARSRAFSHPAARTRRPAVTGNPSAPSRHSCTR